MALPAPVGYLYWYTSSIILFLLTLLNITTKLYHYLNRPKGVRRLSLPGSPGYGANTGDTRPPAISPESSPSSTDTHVEKQRSSSFSTTSSNRAPTLFCTVERVVRAGTLLLSKHVGLTALPYPRVRLNFWKKVKRQSKRAVPTPELLWMGGYTLGCLVLSFYGTSFDLVTYANQAAWLAVAQVPMIIALAGKNNLISFLTGIPYDRLNFLHRAAGRLCLLGIWIHAGGQWYRLGGWTSTNWHSHISQWGFTGIFAFTLMTVISSPWFRRRMFEFFLVAHILLAALSLAAFIMHWRATDVWVYPGIGLWIAERLFRATRLILLNKLWIHPTLHASEIPSRATLTTLTPSTILITFPSPAKGLKWSAGHHFYVVMPGMSRLPWEAHPFTAITIPRKSTDASGTGGELSFIVRVRDGFTKRMKEKIDQVRKERCLGLEEKCEISVPAAVEGPYGEPTDFSGYEAVLIFAGGSGISFAVANLLQIVQDVSAGRSRVKVIEIVWMVKSRLHLDWISPILLASIQAVPPNLSVTLHVHVTRQALPRMSLSSTSGDWQTYLADHTSGRKRRRSRLMSTLSWATFRSSGSWGRKSVDGGTRRGSIMPHDPSQYSQNGFSPNNSKNASQNKRGGRRASGNSSDGESSSGRRNSHHDSPVVPFTWTEGYAEGTMPSASVKPSPEETHETRQGFKFTEPFGTGVSRVNELEIVVAQPTPTDGVKPVETFTAPDPIPDYEERDSIEVVLDGTPSATTTDDDRARLDEPFGSPSTGTIRDLERERRSSSAYAHARARMHAASYARRVSELSSPGGSPRGSPTCQLPGSEFQSQSPRTTWTPGTPVHRGSGSGSLPRKTSITIDEPIVHPRRGSMTLSNIADEDKPRRTSSPLILGLPTPRRGSVPNLLIKATSFSMQRSASGGAGGAGTTGSSPLRSSTSHQDLYQQQSGIPDEHSPRASISSTNATSTPPLGSGTGKPTSILLPKPVLQPKPVLLQPLPRGSTVDPSSYLHPGVGVDVEEGEAGMSRSSSANSGLSMASFSTPPPSSPSGDISAMASALAQPSEISRPATPNLAFKQLSEITHTTSDQLRKSIVELSNIPDPRERKESMAVVLGPAEVTLRRRGSLGLENFVRWHEGRADVPGILGDIIQRIDSDHDNLHSHSSSNDVEHDGEKTLDQLEKGRSHNRNRAGRAPRVVVGACGPKSLLDAARQAVKNEMNPSVAIRGGVTVDFHAETFGW